MEKRGTPTDADNVDVHRGNSRDGDVNGQNADNAKGGKDGNSGDDDIIDGAAVNLRITPLANEIGDGFGDDHDGGLERGPHDKDSTVVRIEKDDANNWANPQQANSVDHANPDKDEKPPQEKPSGIRAWFMEKFFPENPKYIGAVNWLWEMFFYILFLVNLSCVMLMMQDSGSFYLFNNSVKAAFIDKQVYLNGNAEPISFDNIDSTDQLWAYVDEVFLPQLLETGITAEENEKVKYVLGTNILIGTPTIRQLKVEYKRKCNSPDKFQSGCYVYGPPFNDDDMVKDKPQNSPIPYVYKKGKYTYSSLYLGRLATYPTGGYVVSIDAPDLPSAAIQMETLKNVSFFDPYTRAVFLDFTLYNPPNNQFCISRLIVETSEHGGFFTSHYIRSINVLRVYSTEGVVLYGFEALLFTFVFYFTIREIRELRKKGLKEYLLDPWTIPDVLSLIMFYLQFSLEAYSFYDIDTELENLPDADGYDFYEMGFLHEQIKVLAAINTVLCYFRIFRYLSAHHRMGELTRTLSVARNDILYFLLMFMIIFVGFMQAFYIAFGSTVTRFRTLRQTLYGLFTSILGEVSLDEITNANQLLGPLLFFSYIMLVFFVLLNMFLAIINQAYDYVRRTEPRDPRAKILRSYLRRKYKNFKRDVLKIEPASKKRDGGANTASKVHPLPGQIRMRGRIRGGEAASGGTSARSDAVISVAPGDGPISVRERDLSSSPHGFDAGPKQSASLYAEPWQRTQQPHSRPISNAHSRDESPMLGTEQWQKLMAILEGDVSARPADETRAALLRIDRRFGDLSEKLEELLILLLDMNRGGRGDEDEDEDANYM
eukprot:TRINITY_DN2620_c0_g1_i8.p1 TRINITY_DN2620_c0_g1~~TRINITY_DN2620_c0_g1_i8.p1  ORF type:complete len:826 (+),score=159.59 TRINITY_DN2620_c0_g1_i8:205-2682(+)